MPKYALATIGFAAILFALACAGGGAVSRELATPTPVAAPTPNTTYATEQAIPGDAQTPTPKTMVTPTATPITPTSTHIPSSSIYAELLRRIPDTLETRALVLVNDYDLVKEVWGIPPLELEADGEARNNYLFEYFYIFSENGTLLRSTHPFISGYDEHAPQREFLGFDLRNVDQSAWAGSPLALGYEVARGSFDPEETSVAINRCLECPEHQSEEFLDIPYYSWGGDNAGNLEKSGAPPPTTPVIAE